MGAHLVVLDLLQIPYEKVILIILVVKNMNSVKGEASRGLRINVNIFFNWLQSIVVQTQNDDAVFLP